mgnify:CR=1 FL=1
MSDLQKTFIKNMKTARNDLSYSQEKLAELCSLSSSFIGEIEIGRRFPSIGNIEKIAGALKLKPYQLFLTDTDKKEFDRLKEFKEIQTELNKKVKKVIDETFFKRL